MDNDFVKNRKYYNIEIAFMKKNEKFNRINVRLTIYKNLLV